LGAGTEFSPSVLAAEVGISASVFIPGAELSDFPSGFTTAPSSLCFIQDDTYQDKNDIDHISQYLVDIIYN
jgi:hypothetical protein